MHTDNTKRAKYLSLTTLSNELCHTFLSNRRPSSRHSKNRIEIIEIKKKYVNELNQKKLDVKPSPTADMHKFNYLMSEQHFTDNMK